MFVPTWLIFLTTGTLIAVLVLTWGIRQHQFEDQDRARYLPLGGLTPQELAEQPPVRKSVTYYMLLSLMALGPLSILAVLFLLLRHGGS